MWHTSAQICTFSFVLTCSFLLYQFFCLSLVFFHSICPIIDSRSTPNFVLVYWERRSFCREGIFYQKIVGRTKMTLVSRVEMGSRPFHCLASNTTRSWSSLLYGLRLKQKDSGWLLALYFCVRLSGQVTNRFIHSFLFPRYFFSK